MAHQPNVFIIQPFDDSFEDLFRDHLVPIFENTGYNINKADSLNSQRNILENIIQGISSADLLVADLTNLNPNVFYELGIAHGIGIPTVLITKDIEELPFDLQAYQTIEYSLRYDEVEDFRKKLSDIAESHKEGAISFGNPVSDYSDVEIAQPSEIETDSSADEQEGDTEDRKKKERTPDKGILDYASESDERLSDLQENIEYITLKTHELESDITAHTQEIGELENKQGSNVRKRANAIAREVAKIFRSYSETVEERTEKINEDLNFIMDGQEKLIEVMDPSDPEQRSILKREKEELDDYVNESKIATRHIDEFRREVSGLTGLNREMTKASRELAATLSSLISVLQEGSAKAERFITLIEQNLSD